MLGKIIKNLKNYQIRQDYISFNHNIFKPNKTSGKLVLIEFNAFHESHVCQSLFSNFLAKKYDLNIVGYFNYCILSAPLNQTIFQKIKLNLGKFFNYKYHAIYKSFGSKYVIRPKINKDKKEFATKIANLIFTKIKNKKDILKIKLEGIYIGDLIYDTYLKSNQLAFVNIKDRNFYSMLVDFINLFYFWKNFFTENDVHSIIGVHSVYSYGLPMRVAISKKINAYTINSRELNKINKKNYFPSTNFLEFPKKFKKLNRTNQKIGLEMAKEILNRRVLGKGGITNHLISNISSFHSKKEKRLIEKNNKIKILICTRNIFDATHVFGNLLFVDNYDWLVFLGNISKKTDYDWYLKTHINLDGKFKFYQPNSNKLIFDIVKKFPKIKILPNNYSHKQIIDEKIDFVLTQHGSVGFEYPMFNIPVINASLNNPQVGYDFNYHPKNIKEYRNLIKNLKKVKKNLKINKNKIYEFYYMRHLFQDRKWLFSKPDEMIKKIGGWDNMMKEQFYDYFIKNVNKSKINQIYNSFEKFILSDYQSLSIEDSNKI